MLNKYEKPNLSLYVWCVTREDLEKIYALFLEIFGVQTLEIKADTRVNGTKIYPSFQSFSEAVSGELKESGMKSLFFSHIASTATSSKSMYLKVFFDEGKNDFELDAEDSDGSLKDWAEVTYGKMQKLVQSLRENDDFEHMFKKMIGREKSRIVFDFDGKIKEKINERLEKAQFGTEKSPIGAHDTFTHLVLPVTAGILLTIFIMNLFSNSQSVGQIMRDFVMPITTGLISGSFLYVIKKRDKTLPISELE